MSSNPNRFNELAVAKRFRLGDLLPDAQNRRLRDWRVKQIAAEFDFGKWSPPVVRENGNSSPTIIEGHHRVVAACKAGLQDKAVICYCHPVIETDERVGEMYIGLNDLLNAVPTDKFLMRLRAGDKTAVAVAAIIDAHGFIGIAERPTDGMIHAPSACEWVYKGGSSKRGEKPQALGFALDAIKSAYGKTKSAVRNDIIRGFGTFAILYPGVDPKELGRKVRERHGETNDLLTDTRQMAEAMGWRSHKAMAHVLRRDYNHGRKTRMLPER